MIKKTTVAVFLSFALTMFHESSIFGWDIQSPRSSISQETWESVYPYLLSEYDELKFKLDEIFNESRVTLNSRTLSDAGFTNVKPRKFSRIVVARHPQFPEYVFKIYLDEQGHKSDEAALYLLIRRVQGALAVQNCIDKHELHANFKVPKKRLYLLPETPMKKKRHSNKQFIIVEEDMNILDKDSNKKAWKSSKITEQSLLGLYYILSEVGLVDCCRIENIPFSEDGKITFIDTEMFGFNSVPARNLKKVLPSNMRRFWSSLYH
jgi:hypothetical protein